MRQTHKPSGSAGNRAPVSRDWTPFEHNLTGVLSSLEEDQFLILSARHGSRCVQFACQGAWGMRAEVISNHFLAEGDRLTRREMAWLRAHGWNAPTGNPAKASPAQDPDGSPNYFTQFASSVPASEIARLTILTLVHGLGFPYPGALAYHSFQSGGAPLSFDALGLPTEAEVNRPLIERVLEVFRKATGIPTLQLDQDGDVTVSYDAITISALSLGDRVRLLTGLAIGVAESPALLAMLNQYNHGPHSLRCFHREQTVFAVQDVPASPLLPAHLETAIREFTTVTDGLAQVLRARLADRTLVVQPDPPVSIQ